MLPDAIILGAAGTYGGSDAGTVSANGPYIPVVGGNTTYNGATQYTNGVTFLAWNGTTWGVYTAVNAGGTLLYTIAGSSSSFTPAALATVSAGVSPGPSFAIITTTLPVNGYLFSGAGQSNCNGTYLPVAGVDTIFDTCTQFSNGAVFLVQSSSFGSWYVIPTIGSLVDGIYYSDLTGTTDSAVIGGWSAAGGASPSPTVVDAPAPPATPATPAAPSGLTVTTTDIGASTPGLLSSLATSYSVQYSLNGGSTWNDVASTLTTDVGNLGASTAWNTGSVFTPGSTTNQVRYNAWNAYGNTEGAASANQDTLCVAPSGFTGEVSGLDIDFAWDAVTGGVTFNIQSSPTGDGTWSNLATGLSGTAATHAPGGYGAGYDYRIRAVNASGGVGGASVSVNDLEIATPVDTPTVTGFAFTEGADGMVSLSGD